MFISRVVIRNYRNLKLVDTALPNGTSCVIGENNSGKSNFVHAIRLAVDANLSSYFRNLTVDDFTVGQDIKTPREILVSLEFSDFAGRENQEAFLYDFSIRDGVARITYRFRPKRPVREAIRAKARKDNDLTFEDYGWEIVGGGDKNPTTVEWHEDFGRWVRFEDLQQAYLVTYLEPLRDVETRLRQTRNSPLTRLLTGSNISEAEQAALVWILEKANKDISASKTIKGVGASITSSFAKAAGAAYAMDVRVGMVAPTFGDISRSLGVLLSTRVLKDFDPSFNGLGLNNILYLSMVWEFFTRRIGESRTAGQILLIEEPEAHLHPQLQRMLFGTLQRQSFQTIVTTHGTHITSQAPLASMVVLTVGGAAGSAAVNPVSAPGLSKADVMDLERYLDATQGALLYAKAVMLVEGPAELFLIPRLSELLLGKRLEEYGVEIVPIYGVHFPPYAHLFGTNGIERRCAIVADGDLQPSDGGLADSEEFQDIPKENLLALKGGNVNVFLCKTTFELELASPDNLEMFVVAARDAGAKKAADKLEALRGELLSGKHKGVALAAKEQEARERVLRLAKRIGKARYAQAASKHASKAKSVPKYIADAIGWLTEL